MESFGNLIFTDVQEVLLVEISLLVEKQKGSPLIFQIPGNRQAILVYSSMSYPMPLILECWCKKGWNIGDNVY